MPGEIALGFRVKSGFAVAVALAGTSAAPIPLARRIVQLSDPAIEETKQPYHDGVGTAQEDLKEVARLTRIIHACAKQSVADLLSDEVLAGGHCRRAGVIVGSVIDPAKVGNLHIRAHANEGRLFRVVLEEALSAHGVQCVVMVEKTLDAQAQKTLGRAASQIRKIVGAFGDSLGGPWRAEEKAAAIAGWVVLGTAGP